MTNFAPTMSLASYRDELCAQIDAEADRQCERYITPGLTQQERYAEKRREAEAILGSAGGGSTVGVTVQVGAVTPKPSTPLLDEEAKLRGIALADMAKMVLAARERSTLGCRPIERARIEHKMAVRAAKDAATARAAAQIDWSKIA